MKYVRYVVLAAMLLGLYSWVGVPVVSAAAVTIPPDPTTTPDTLPTSPVMITAYQINGSSIQFVQIYNNTNDLISLGGSQFVYSYTTDLAGSTRTALALSGLVEPKKHILIALEGLLVDSAYPEHFFSTTVSAPAVISSIQLLMPGMAPATVPTTLKTNNTIQQRGKTSTGYSTVTFGDFSGDLYADQLYEAPEAPPLKIVEISPRAKSCEPFSLDATCGDFVKLLILPGYNDDTLTSYRLKSDDSAESVTNTFSLIYASKQGDYLLIRLRDDGQLMSLTNSGGYVWLEDIYGEVHYDETLTGYADAGSETYINQSWALDMNDDIWKWAIPSPTGPNQFPQPVSAGMGAGLDETTCPAGKYRNPETNRCRSLEEAVSALAVCEEGKERNPVTNRCRNLATTSSTSLSPCAEGEERNPATNRCRKVLGTATTLVPCQSGYERNPETNRCKKVSDTLTALASPAAVAIESSGGDTLKNALIVTAGLGALGYGFYEWRSELLRALRRLAGLVSGK